MIVASGSLSLVRRMLEDFKLPWTILPKEWRWARPLAAPVAILTRVSQFGGSLPDPLLPAINCASSISRYMIDM